MIVVITHQDTIQRTMALYFVESRQMALAQAARFAALDLEEFIELLGANGIDAVDYPPEELEAELDHAL